MDFLANLLENSTMPWLSAMVLGLMTAMSPCPLATNITAIGFISKDIENRNRVFMNGIFYTLGRAISYTVLPLIIFFGADQLKFSGFFQRYGEKMLGPLLIFIGLLMFDLIRIKFPGLTRLTSKLETKSKWGYLDSLILGSVFALAFCPYSGVLFFGILVPMTISSASGLYLPLVFAIATGVPVILFSWLLAYSIGSIGRVYDKMRNFEIWFRRLVAFLFIGIGFYYLISRLL